MEITKDMVFLVAPAAEPTSAETAWQATWLRVRSPADAVHRLDQQHAPAAVVQSPRGGDSGGTRADYGDVDFHLAGSEAA